MRRHSHWLFTSTSPSDQAKTRGSLVTFSLLVFLILIGEAIMSYFVPIYLEAHTQSTYWMGIILSASYVAGLLADIVMGEVFKNKPFYRFLFWGSLLSLCFSLSFLVLPPLIMCFLFSMVIWGLYLELITSSKYHFIKHFLPHNEHVLGWSVIGGFSDAAYLVGPLIAGLLISYSTITVLGGAFLFYLMGFLGFLLFMFIFRKKLNRYQQPEVFHPNFLHEFSVWKLLIPKIWPILLFTFSLNILDASMWTIGPILAQKLNTTSPLGSFLYVAYLLPSLFMALVSHDLTQHFGKKRTGFLLGTFSGLIYILAGISQSPLIFVGLFFLASVANAIIWPAIYGAIEDYVERLGTESNLMVSLQNSTTSLAYIVGTIVSGLLASMFGEQHTFSLLGIFVLISALLGLVIMHHKVRLPESEIHNLK